MKSKSDKIPKVSFLVGSGFSIPEGLPSVRDVNARLSKVDESEILIHTDQTAIFLNGQEDRNRWANSRERLFFQKFLEFYSSECLSDNEEFNYEEFYDFYSNYIHEGKNKETIESFYNDYVQQNNSDGKIKFKDCRNCLIDFNRTFNQLLASLLHSRKYFSDIDKSGHYPYDSFIFFLKEILKSSEIKFHTLNHDLFFDWLGSSQSGLWEHYSDGYELEGSPFYGEVYCTFNEGTEREVRKQYYAKLKRFTDKYDTPLALYKLHGSIYNKVVYTPQPNQELIRIKDDYSINRYFMEVEDSITKKKKLESVFDEVYPDFLSGTTNKIRSYSGDPYYKNIFQHFKKNLNDSEILIVTGYGFNDGGINEIIEENYLREGKEMIIIDPFKPKTKLIEKYNVKLIIKGITELNNQEFIDLLPEQLKEKREIYKSIFGNYIGEI